MNTFRDADSLSSQEREEDGNVEMSSVEGAWRLGRSVDARECETSRRENNAIVDGGSEGGREEEWQSGSGGNGREKDPGLNPGRRNADWVEWRVQVDVGGTGCMVWSGMAR